MYLYFNFNWHNNYSAAIDDGYDDDNEYNKLIAFIFFTSIYLITWTGVLDSCGQTVNFEQTRNSSHE